MSSDLKSARAYVIPLGGKETKKTVNILTEFSYLVRKALSKKLRYKISSPDCILLEINLLIMQKELKN